MARDARWPSSVPCRRHRAASSSAARAWFPASHASAEQAGCQANRRAQERRAAKGDCAAARYATASDAAQRPSRREPDTPKPSPDSGRSLQPAQRRRQRLRGRVLRLLQPPSMILAWQRHQPAANQITLRSVTQLCLAVACCGCVWRLRSQPPAGDFRARVRPSAVPRQPGHISHVAGILTRDAVCGAAFSRRSVFRIHVRF